MIKIAIIEDDPTISQMYRMKFESDGFDVRLAANGQIGIEVVEKFQPDIILLDLQMPEMDGAEALKRIRSKDWGKTIPVIVMSGKDPTVDEQNFLRERVSTVLKKGSHSAGDLLASIKARLRPGSAEQQD